MAVERTMASWISASFAAIGVGLGLRALFAQIEPSWVPRLISSMFLALAIVMILNAERRMCRAMGRLSSHQIHPPTRAGLRYSAYVIAAATAVLIGAIWLV
jgi:putative membrane protein